MGIQVIGTKKDKETMKALRFLKERGIDVHLVDLRERALSPGELRNIAECVGADAMIDTESSRYRERGFSYMVYDPLEELQADQELLKIPVIRNGRRVLLGFDGAKLLELLNPGTDT